ncbi:hypothetical protein [Taibaiella soli]|nr:hypothetical protein [Taibaiella soli]
MGPLKLGATPKEVAAALKTKLRLKKRRADYTYEDTLTIKRNGENYRLLFSYSFNQDKPIAYLCNIYSNNTKQKTPAGIGIGCTKAQLLAAYDYQNLDIRNDNDFANSRTQYITLYDCDSGTQIIFTLVDHFIAAMEITYTANDC